MFLSTTEVAVQQISSGNVMSSTNAAYLRGNYSTKVAMAVAESWAAVQNGSNNAELSGRRPSFNSIEPVSKIM